MRLLRGAFFYPDITGSFAFSTKVPLKRKKNRHKLHYSVTVNAKMKWLPAPGACVQTSGAFVFASAQFSIWQ